jgi:hypothetical protein
MEGLPPAVESAPEGRREIPSPSLTTDPAPRVHPRAWGPCGVPRPAGRVVRVPLAPTAPPEPRTEIPSPVLDGIGAGR